MLKKVCVDVTSHHCSAVKASLARLGLEYVDLYLIHCPFVVKDIPSKWAEMESLVEKGYVQYTTKLFY